jgi:hypothetical protein
MPAKFASELRIAPAMTTAGNTGKPNEANADSGAPADELL